ncbi:hypothetical protein V5O48_017831 [Marasmius crinis-equi]|uniref:Ubiquitin-like domain-containing protein n=1 Tax=Marasmius crinis-equi TaxID=585013 RepID=A0ABR3EN25_9AGAR
METKDYDICEDRLFEIDANAFPFLVPTLRAVHITTANEGSTRGGENRNGNDTQKRRIEPCMGVPRRIAQYTTVDERDQSESPHPASENPNQNATVEDPNDPIFVKVIGPKNETWLKLRTTTVMAAVLEKICAMFVNEKIMGLEILTDEDGNTIQCEMNVTAADLGITEGDLIQLVLSKEAEEDT